MAEYSDFIYDEDAPMVYIKPKKKKHHVGLIILIVFVVIILLIVGAIAGVVGMAFYYLYDDTQLDIDYDNGGSLNDLFEDLIFDALDIEEENGEHLFQISITETQLTEIIHTELNQAFDTSSFPLHNYYVDFHDDDMTLVIEVDISFFKTRLILDTTLYTEVDEEDWTNSQLCFGIENIQIGKIGGIETVTFDVLDALGIDIGYYIESMSDFGISLGFDRENLMLTYKFSDLVNDIFSFVSLGEAQAYLDVYLNVMLEQNLFRIDIKDDNSLTFNVNVDGFIGDNPNDSYTDMNLMRNYMEVLASSGSISTSSEVNAVYSLFLNGYDNLTDDTKEIVDDIDFSPLGINQDLDKLPCAGDKYTSDLSSILSGVLDINQFFTEDGLVYEGSLVALPLSDLNAYVNSLGITGIGYFMLKDEEIRYIGLNNLGLAYDDETEIMSLFLTLDFNGYIIPISIDYKITAYEYEQDEEGNTIGEAALGLDYAGNTFGSYTMGDTALDELILSIEEEITDGQFITMNDTELQLNLGIDTLINEVIQDYIFGATISGDTTLNDLMDFLREYGNYDFSFSFTYSYKVNSESIGVDYSINASDDLKSIIDMLFTGDYSGLYEVFEQIFEDLYGQGGDDGGDDGGDTDPDDEEP
ncbi:MAG: hypothetical protein LUD22_03445 [Coprobacillus sp.]|nr:hypothetical protein [Coprobacillus sp.]